MDNRHDILQLLRQVADGSATPEVPLPGIGDGQPGDGVVVQGDGPRHQLRRFGGLVGPSSSCWRASFRWCWSGGQKS